MPNTVVSEIWKYVYLWGADVTLKNPKQVLSSVYNRVSLVGYIYPSVHELLCTWYNSQASGPTGFNYWISVDPAFP